jgi:hypothetical protein
MPAHLFASHILKSRRIGGGGKKFIGFLVDHLTENRTQRRFFSSGEME